LLNKTTETQKIKGDRKLDALRWRNAASCSYGST